MIRNYNIIWFPTRDGEKLSRQTFVRLTNPTGKTEYDAKAALSIFMSECGNLKKNTIVKIIEMDENGQIGKDIVPTDGSSIIPAGR